MEDKVGGKVNANQDVELVVRGEQAYMYLNQLESGAAKRNAKYHMPYTGGAVTAPRPWGATHQTTLLFLPLAATNSCSSQQESQAQRWLQSRSKRTFAIRRPYQPQVSARWAQNTKLTESNR